MYFGFIFYRLGKVSTFSYISDCFVSSKYHRWIHMIFSTARVLSVCQWHIGMSLPNFYILNLSNTDVELTWWAIIITRSLQNSYSSGNVESERLYYDSAGQTVDSTAVQLMLIYVQSRTRVPYNNLNCLIDTVYSEYWNSMHGVF